MYKQEIEEKSQNLNELALRLENLSNEDSPTNEVVEEYENRIRNLESELAKTKESSSNITSVIEEKNAIIEEQGKRLSQVKLEKTDKEIESIKLKEQIEDYKNEIEKLSGSKNNYMLEANKSLEETEKYKNKYEDIERLLRAKSKEEESLKGQLFEQTDKINHLQAQINKLKENKESEIKVSTTEIDNSDFEVSNEPKSIDDFLENADDEIFENEEVNKKLNFSFNSFENPLEIGLEDENINLELDDPYQMGNDQNKESEVAQSDFPFLETETSDLPQHSEFAHLIYGDVSVVSVNIPRATMDIASKFKEYLKYYD